MDTDFDVFRYTKNFFNIPTSVYFKSSAERQLKKLSNYNNENKNKVLGWLRAYNNTELR